MKNHTLLFLLLVWLSSGLTAQAPTPVDYLVFEGAGMRGIAYCGALMELNDRKLITGIKGVAGTSSGAITASLYAVGYTPEEIFQLIGETDFQKFNDGGGRAIGGFYRLKHKWGWYKGDAFLKWIEKQIGLKTGNPNITFAELKQGAKSHADWRPLVVAATSMNHQQTLLFDAEHWPQMRIVDAVRASMAVPFYFEPLIIDFEGHVIETNRITPQMHVCLDGGFTANFCIQTFDTIGPNGERIAAHTLGLRIDSDEQIQQDQIDKNLCYQPIATSSDLMKTLYYITKENLNRASLTDADWARTVSISDGQIGPKVKKLSTEQKNKLIQAGRNGVIAYYN